VGDYIDGKKHLWINTGDLTPKAKRELLLRLLALSLGPQRGHVLAYRIPCRTEFRPQPGRRPLRACRRIIRSFLECGMLLWYGR
jgi:hypothetical protein